MRSDKSFFLVSLTAVGILLFSVPAAALPLFGSAQNFAVLAASTITNTGRTSIYDDMGLAPGNSITGAGSITLAGASQSTTVPQQAQNRARSTYTDLATSSFTRDLTAQDFGGLTRNPGVYRFASSARLTGSLTHDDDNNPNATWVFQNGSSATLGTATVFAGNIIADQSITVTTGPSFSCGRASALVGSVTLGTNTISNDCIGGAARSSGRSDAGRLGFSGGASPVFEPSTGALMGSGVLAWFSKRRTPVCDSCGLTRLLEFCRPPTDPAIATLHDAVARQPSLVGCVFQRSWTPISG